MVHLSIHLQADTDVPVYSTDRLPVICRCTAFAEPGLLCQLTEENPEFIVHMCDCRGAAVHNVHVLFYRKVAGSNLCVRLPMKTNVEPDLTRLIRRNGHPGRAVQKESRAVLCLRCAALNESGARASYSPARSENSNAQLS